MPRFVVIDDVAAAGREKEEGGAAGGESGAAVKNSQNVSALVYVLHKSHYKEDV
jgi:hypothetical protein